MDLKLEELQANMFAPELYERLRLLDDQNRAQAWQTKMASQESPEAVAPQLLTVGVACYVQLEVMMVSEMWRCSKEEPDPERTASYAGVSDVPTPPGSPSTDTEALKCWSARVL